MLLYSQSLKRLALYLVQLKVELPRCRCVSIITSLADFYFPMRHTISISHCRLCFNADYIYFHSYEPIWNIPRLSSLNPGRWNWPFNTYTMLRYESNTTVIFGIQDTNKNRSWRATFMAPLIYIKFDPYICTWAATQKG